MFIVHEYTCVWVQVLVGVQAYANIHMCSNVICGGQRSTTNHSPQMPFTLILENGCVPVIELTKYTEHGAPGILLPWLLQHWVISTYNYIHHLQKNLRIELNILNCFINYLALSILCFLFVCYFVFINFYRQLTLNIVLNEKHILVKNWIKHEIIFLVFSMTLGSRIVSLDSFLGLSE